MDRLLFCGTAQVQIQGETILRYLTLSQGQAKYQLHSRDGAAITILDDRPLGLQAVRRVFETGRLDALLHRLNAPAEVAICTNGSQNLRVEIHDSFDTAPQYRLWITIGQQEALPDYPCCLHQSMRLDDGPMALLALQDLSHPIQQQSPTCVFFPQML